PGAPALGVPSQERYKQAAVAVIRATEGSGTAQPALSSPLAWNALAASLPEEPGAAVRLRNDVTLYLALNGALQDAAVTAYRAKRSYQSPRPISMIRYLAFQGQSSNRKAPSYSAEGLPLVPGLIKLVNGRVAVRSGGRWVLGSRWTPPAATPASPGWVSDTSAYAAAANTVLSALTGKSFVHQSAQASDSGAASGIDL